MQYSTIFTNLDECTHYIHNSFLSTLSAQHSFRLFIPLWNNILNTNVHVSTCFKYCMYQIWVGCYFAIIIKKKPVFLNAVLYHLCFVLIKRRFSTKTCYLKITQAPFNARVRNIRILTNQVWLQFLYVENKPIKFYMNSDTLLTVEEMCT